MKDIEWLRKELVRREDNFVKLVENEQGVDYNSGKQVATRQSISLINQLDEPEVLSQEWIDSSSVYIRSDGVTEEYVHVDDLKNLLVPKQEEVDRAYKDGYEKRKEHATRDDEPETVAMVFVDYLIASSKLKLALKMEVEEME